MQPDPDFWREREVCVTGGTGFLGTHLVRQLVALQARVRVLALPPRAGHPLRELPTIEWHAGDLLDEKVVAPALAGCATVFHTAGFVAVWGPALRRLHAVHVGGTRLVLQHAGDATVVHTSSIVAVGAHPQPQVLDEDAPWNLGTLPVDYVHAKRAAEEVALGAAASGQRVVVVNPGYLVGPDDHKRSVMGRMCLRFWKGRLCVVPRSGYNLVDVRDVACGQLLAAERGVSGRRYILGGDNWTMRQFLSELARVNGYRPRGLLPLPAWMLDALARVAEWRGKTTGREPYPSVQHAALNRLFWYVRSDRAARELGYRPRPLAETIADTYVWFQQQEPLTLRGFQRWWMRPAAGVRGQLPPCPSTSPLFAGCSPQGSDGQPPFG